MQVKKLPKFETVDSLTKKRMPRLKTESAKKMDPNQSEFSEETRL